MSDYPSIRPSLNLEFARTKKLDPRITFRRASTGTYVDSDGLIKTAGIDVPRFDHDPVTGVCKGLLVEESRTNLALRSEELGTLGTYAGGVVVPDFGLSPSGLLNARRLSPGAKAGPHGAIFYNNNGYAPNGWQISAYVKPLGLPKLGILINSNWGLQYPVSTIDFNSLAFTGTSFGTPGSGVLQSVIGQSVANVGNGWYRVTWRWVYEQSSTVTMSFICGLSTSGDHGAGQASWNFNGAPYVNNGFLIWGIQIEAGAFPTSYIPTTASTVTRSADLASMTGTNFSSWYNQSEGTILTNINLISSAQDDRDYGAYFASGSDTTTRIRHDYTTAGGALTALQLYSNTTSLIAAPNSSFSSRARRVASAVRVGSIAFAANGRLTTSVASTMPTTVDRVFLTGRVGSGLNKTISRIAYWPKRLPDAQLQALTQR